MKKGGQSLCELSSLKSRQQILLLWKYYSVIAISLETQGWDGRLCLSPPPSLPCDCHILGDPGTRWSTVPLPSPLSSLWLPYPWRPRDEMVDCASPLPPLFPVIAISLETQGQDGRLCLSPPPSLPCDCHILGDPGTRWSTVPLPSPLSSLWLPYLLETQGRDGRLCLFPPPSLVSSLFPEELQITLFISLHIA